MYDQDDFYQPRWYAVRTRSNHEKTVMQSLSARDVPCVLATYETLSTWKDRKVLLEKPLFPGYIFVRFSAEAKTTVLTSPGVVQLLCRDAVHDAINSKVVDLFSQKSLLHGALPEPSLPAGCRVTIVRGSFAGVEGVISELRGGHRLVVLIPSIVRAFSVQVDLADVRESSTLHVPAAIAAASHYRACI